MKSSNTNKNTIEFHSKKQELEGSHNKKYFKRDKLKFHKISDDSHKVLEYPTKRRKSVKKIIEFKDNLKNKFKNKKYIKIILIGVTLTGLLFLFNKVVLPNNTNTKSTPSNLIAESTYISKSKALTYSKIINETIKTYTGLNHNVKTETMHKNGSSIYATGYIDYPDKGKIYFDVRLKNNNPISLVINGEELIK